MRFPATLKTEQIDVETKALIDSGADELFIHEELVDKYKIPVLPLDEPISVKNVDGTENKRGEVTHFTWIPMRIGDYEEQHRFYVSNLGKDHLILGLPWLEKVNPIIDWAEKTMEIRKERIRRSLAYALKKDTEINRLRSNDIKQRKEDLVQEDRSTSSLNIRILMKEETLAENELVYAYTKGEPVLGVLQTTESPLTQEYDGPRYVYDKTIRRFTLAKESARYCHSRAVWIRAKTSISQTLEHRLGSEGREKKTLEQMVPEPFLKYRKVFEKAASERFPESKPWDHAIDLKPDFVSKDCKIYPLTPKEQLKLDEFLDENLKKGYIRPSRSPMASPFFFVSKKEDDALRPCQDYRRLNEGTIKNSYPLPLIEELITKTGKAQYFTKLDVRWGYNNIRIKKGDEWKAAFKTNRGLFEPTVMFFGMCNSPGTFQLMMNHIFRDMITEGWLEIYMDDLLIVSESLLENHRRTLRVLQRLAEHDLYLKPEKCKFDVQEVEFLGMILRPGHIAMDPTKLAGIRDWQPPTTVKGVRSFLGFGNFYRKFIGHYAEIAKPLNELTKKDRTFEWTPLCQTAFENLKQKFAEGPVLLIPDPTKQFVVESDASKWATGAVLRQQDMNGDWHPCGYISHTFDATQRNYEIYDRELLGIIRALETWRHYFLGSPHPITILSDHKNLTYFRSAQKLNRRQARWSLLLSQYDLKLVHVPGSQMVQSDALSRRPDWIQEKDDDNENRVLLPEELFVRVIDTELRSRIVESMMGDDLIKDAVLALKTKGPPPIKSNLSDWKIDDGLLFFKEKCVVPPNEELRRNLV